MDVKSSKPQIRPTSAFDDETAEKELTSELDKQTTDGPAEVWEIDQCNEELKKCVNKLKTLEAQKPTYKELVSKVEKLEKENEKLNKELNVLQNPLNTKIHCYRRLLFGDGPKHGKNVDGLKQVVEKLMHPPKKYNLELWTGDMEDADTGAIVFITLFGQNGDSGEQRLDKQGERFGRGKKDEFNIACADLGHLAKLTIGHDNGGKSPNWFLDKVIVEDVDEKAKYEFPCNRWLERGEDDIQETCVKLVLSVKTNEEQGLASCSTVASKCPTSV